MTPDEAISTREGAALFVAMLERAEWKFSLTREGHLRLIIGDDDPPRWPQRKILAVLDALAPQLIGLLAERDGLNGVGDGGAIH